MRALRRSGLVLAAAAALGGAVSVSGCSTATPVLVQASKLPALQGKVETTAGYTGRITTDNRLCRGSFTGILGNPVATAEIACGDGRSGIGTATIQDGYFVSAEITLSDGSRLTIRPSGPSFP